MGKWTKTTAGVLFLAVSSVYAGREIAATVRNGATAADSYAAQPAKSHQLNQAKNVVMAAPADSSTDVKLLEGSADPFASGPATQPTGATSKPSTEGQSVSSTEVSVSDAGTVEIHVNDANLVEVLRMLSLQSQRNIIASKDVRGTVTANLYDVTVREALDAILHANGYGYREKGNFIYVYTTKELQDIEKAERQMKTEVFRLYNTPAANASTLIKPVMSAAGQFAVTTPAVVGINASSTAAGGDAHGGEDMIVVTDYPENLDAIRKILAEVDKRPQQILLEATILRASLNEDNALGIDFTVLGGVDFAGVSGLGGPASILTGSILSDPLGTSVVNQNAAGAQTGFTGTMPAGGLRVGVVTNNVAVFLQALEQTTDTTVLANPKVLTLNKQKGEVFVGNEDGYYTTVTTETTTSQQVDSLKTGTRLIFRPYIANDGFIRLEVHPEDSDGSVKANGLPSKTTTEVTTDVMVKDGHTIVIGGLFRESSTTTHSQVPLLGNIPLAGLLFKNQRDRTVRDEVIILLTPHVVKDDSAYASLSEEQSRRAEDLRVGVRKGMMPWGRERLAESAYEKAKKELNGAHPDRHLAIWHLNEATNLNPTFAEAIELKEQLSGKVVSEAHGSSIRGFVKQAIMRDTAPATRPVADALDFIEAPRISPTSMPTASAPAATQPSEATVQAPFEESFSAPAEEMTTDSKAQDFSAEAHSNGSTTQSSDESVTELPTDELAPNSKSGQE